MDTMIYSVQMKQLIREFNLDILYGPEGYETKPIVNDDVNRPALQLTGFFDYFDSTRIQVLGMVEYMYLNGLPSEERARRLDRLLATDIPLLIVTRSLNIFPELMEAAQKYQITLARTKEVTSAFTAALTASLKVHLGPRTTLPGVFVEVYGEGILLLGDSGIGKSETAIELLKRGHRLIADDAVDIKRVSAKTLVGSSPEMIRHFIELRGIGIVDVRRLFGVGAVKLTEKVDLIINMEPWEEGKMYDRLGLEEHTTSILNIKVPSMTIPVKPGRNLAMIIEVAAMNNRDKKMGHNSAKVLTDKIYERMVAEQGSEGRQGS